MSSGYRGYAGAEGAGALEDDLSELLLLDPKSECFSLVARFDAVYLEGAGSGKKVSWLRELLCGWELDGKLAEPLSGFREELWLKAGWEVNEKEEEGGEGREACPRLLTKSRRSSARPGLVYREEGWLLEGRGGGAEVPQLSWGMSETLIWTTFAGRLMDRARGSEMCFRFSAGFSCSSSGITMEDAICRTQHRKHQCSQSESTAGYLYCRHQTPRIGMNLPGSIQPSSKTCVVDLKCFQSNPLKPLDKNRWKHQGLESTAEILCVTVSAQVDLIDVWSVQL